jgi:hypothetical protein
VQSSLHVLDPDSLHEQPFVHSISVQGPLPEHSIEHWLPAHDRLTVPEESPFTVHPPAGHENVQGPLPWQTNSQPAAGQESSQGSDVTQKHGCPGVQLVELVVCVVATHATSSDRPTMRPARRMVASPSTVSPGRPAGEGSFSRRYCSMQ